MLTRGCCRCHGTGVQDVAVEAVLTRVCPQCGFASSIKGNPMTEAEEEAKLRRVVEVAQRAWSDAV